MMQIRQRTTVQEIPLPSSWPAADHESDDYSTLVLDNFGRVRSCGESAEHLFHLPQARLVGMWAADLVPSLFAQSGARSYRARQLAYLSGDSSWRPHRMTDATGRSFNVELSLARVTTDGQEIFIVHLHRLGEMA